MLPLHKNDLRMNFQSYGLKGEFKIKNLKYRKQILSIIIIASMICNIVPQVEAVGNQLSNVEQSDPVQFKKELKFDWIYVFYDPSDEDMKYLGKSVYQILNYRIYNIKLIPIKSLGELQSKLNEKPWIGIYAFNSNLTGIFINQKFYQWEDYYGVLALHQDTKHIVGMGNTISLKVSIQMGIKQSLSMIVMPIKLIYCYWSYMIFGQFQKLRINAH